MTDEDPQVPERRYLWAALPFVFLLGLIAWILWPNLETVSADLGGVPVGHSLDSGTSQSVTAKVDAVAVARTSLPVLARATGHLRPWREVTLGFGIAGRVAWRDATEGDRVESGESLARLDTQDLILEQSEAEANLLKARANFAISFVNSGLEQARGAEAPPLEAQEALRSHDRNLELYREGLLPKEDFERSRRRLEAAQMLTGERREDVQAATSGLTQAELAFEWAELALRRANLVAPFSGRIADLDLEVGQQLSAGHPCLVLMDDSRVKVDVEVLESDMVHLRPGTPATVRVPSLGERQFVGEVHSVNPRVDPESGTGRVTVMIKNPEGTLLPGLFAAVDLEPQTLKNRVVVPEEAILERQGKTLVFLLEEETALWTYVTVGIRSGGLAEILEGLEEGQQVAVAGHFALAHQSPVEIRLVEAPATRDGGTP